MKFRENRKFKKREIPIPKRAVNVLKKLQKCINADLTHSIKIILKLT
jgi:hypothetical protein